MREIYEKKHELIAAFGERAWFLDNNHTCGSCRNEDDLYCGIKHKAVGLEDGKDCGGYVYIERE
jgi:hypothetical protein